jgi:hypothetical protein
MFQMPAGRLCDFTVRCKDCGENVPAPVETLPDSWIVEVCPLCGGKRRYLPNEIFQGRLSRKLTPQMLRHMVHRWD